MASSHCSNRLCYRLRSIFFLLIILVSLRMLASKWWWQVSYIHSIAFNHASGRSQGNYWFCFLFGGSFIYLEIFSFIIIITIHNWSIRL